MSNIKYCFQLLNKPIFTLPFEYLTNNGFKDDKASLYRQYYYNHDFPNKRMKKTISFLLAGEHFRKRVPRIL